jgi:hypothetical protein
MQTQAVEKSRTRPIAGLRSVKPGGNIFVKEDLLRMICRMGKYLPTRLSRQARLWDAQIDA